MFFLQVGQFDFLLMNLQTSSHAGKRKKFDAIVSYNILLREFFNNLTNLFKIEHSFHCNIEKHCMLQNTGLRQTAYFGYM